MRSTKVVADEVVDEGETVDFLDILGGNDCFREAGDGGLRFGSSGRVNEGEVECEVTEFL